MKQLLTPETQAIIEARAKLPRGSLLGLDNPLKVMRVDFTLREISVITGLSLRTLSRHSTNYSFKSVSHKVLASFALDYVTNVINNPELDGPLVRIIYEKCKEWYKQ